MSPGSCLGCGPKQESLFLEAVEQDNCGKVESMLQMRPLLLKDQSLTSKGTAWHTAARLGHAEVLKVMAAAVLKAGNAERLSSGVRCLLAMPTSAASLLLTYVNQPSRKGYTPLMLAAGGGHDKCVSFLLSLGEAAEGTALWLSNMVI